MLYFKKTSQCTFSVLGQDGFTRKKPRGLWLTLGNGFEFVYVTGRENSLVL